MIAVVCRPHTITLALQCEGCGRRGPARRVARPLAGAGELDRIVSRLADRARDADWIVLRIVPVVLCPDCWAAGRVQQDPS